MSREELERQASSTAWCASPWASRTGATSCEISATLWTRAEALTRQPARSEGRRPPVGHVSVLLGNGHGTFQPTFSFPAGNGPMNAAVADFKQGEYHEAMHWHERPAVSQRGATFIAAALGASLLATTGCKGGGNNSTAAAGTGGSTAANGTSSSTTANGTSNSMTSAGTSSSMTSTGVGGSFPVDAGSCAPDPLHTGLPPLFNGNSVDSDDCPILEFTAKYGEPDAMIFKAIIYVESRFQYDAVGCTGNSGCCPARGWTGAECGCLGAMQTGPWCNPTNLPPGCTGNDGLGLLPNMHVDLETNPSAADWANSVFNPDDQHRPRHRRHRLQPRSGEGTVPRLLTISSERGEVTSLSDQQSAQGTATRLCAEGEAQRSAGVARCVDASG